MPLLSYIDAVHYRRHILIQLNRGESRHQLAHAIFYGQRGEVHQHYRESQEDQLGVLDLVLNMWGLWNPAYVEAALNQLRREGKIEVKPEDVARPGPLGFSHCTMLGRYYVELSEEIRGGQLRPLHKPANGED